MLNQQSMFFNSWIDDNHDNKVNRFYPQTTAVIRALFVVRYFDQFQTNALKKYKLTVTFILMCTCHRPWWCKLIMLYLVTSTDVIVLTSFLVLVRVLPTRLVRNYEVYYHLTHPLHNSAIDSITRMGIIVYSILVADLVVHPDCKLLFYQPHWHCFDPVLRSPFLKYGAKLSIIHH